MLHANEYIDQLADEEVRHTRETWTRIAMIVLVLAGLYLAIEYSALIVLIPEMFGINSLRDAGQNDLDNGERAA